MAALVRWSWIILIAPSATARKRIRSHWANICTTTCFRTARLTRIWIRTFDGVISYQIDCSSFIICPNQARLIDCMRTWVQTSIWLLLLYTFNHLWCLLDRKQPEEVLVAHGNFLCPFNADCSYFAQIDPHSDEYRKVLHWGGSFFRLNLFYLDFFHT